MKSKITCKDCFFYTGIQCHGHGDYWGTCNVIMGFYKYLKQSYDSFKECDLDVYKAMCVDNTICKFYSLLKENNNG